MKKALIMISLLSAVCANMHAMDGGGRQRLIEHYHKESMPINNDDNNKNPPPYQPPTPYPQSAGASAPLLDIDPEVGGSGFPKATDIYNGKLYSSGTTTYRQFWQAHNIPENEQYRSGPLLDQFLADLKRKNNSMDNVLFCEGFWDTHNFFFCDCDIERQAALRKNKLTDEFKARLQQSEDAQDALMCGICCGKACCCVCAAGVLAGAITGLVYCCKSLDDGWDYDWQPNQPPFAPTSMQSYSQSMTQIVTALVSKSKKME